MYRNHIIPYNPKLKALARELRLNSTKAEARLWKYIKCRSTGYEFHRQVPIDDYIIDFYCHELKLAIEVDGHTHDYNFAADEQRQKKLEGFGIRFLRFTDEDVLRHLTDVLREIQSNIEGFKHPDSLPP
jgi:very-short-patch-repair endonuclease